LAKLFINSKESKW